MIFCCSQKLQKLLGLKEKDLSPASADEAAEWYCNLAAFERRKCLIFTHGSTLYTILVLDVKKADLADFGGLFRRRLNAMLLLDNFSREHRELLTRDAPDSFAKATDRGVIGSMVDHVRICRHLIAHEGGLGRIDVDKLNRIFSYARNSCDRNHRRQTLCGFHHNEEHEGDWKDCPACRDSFETEMYVWYGTNEYNFEKLPNPPSYAPTKCSKCGAVIKLGTEGFTQRGAEYLCEPCSEKETAKLLDKTRPPGGPLVGRPRRS